MSETAQPLLHVTCADQDEDWVQAVLIPALKLRDDQIWTRSEADPAGLKLEELERAVKSHRYTLLVASRAAHVDEWTKFGAHLAQHLGVEEGKPRLLLAALDFEPGSERARELVPLAQRCLDCFDCSTPDRTLVAMAKLAGQLAVTTTADPATECPYPGLRMFGADDPGGFHRIDLFFGRDEEGRAIVEKLRGGGRVLLVGPSGCGKSSLVRARVLPALIQGAAAMAHAIMRPGAHPDTALRAALDALDPRLGPATDAYLEALDAGLAADAEAAEAALVAATAGPGRLLLLDQLEEVFHEQVRGGGEHARFFARLAALGRVPGLALLLNMRADFYGDLMHSPAWDDFKDHRVELAPMRGAALREAITRPAEVVGVYVEPDLVERLVREADQDRAAEALPLLQVALAQLWGERVWRYLSLGSYEQLTEGERRGLDVVLGRHADACLAALAAPEHVLARRVLIDLVQLGEGRPDTRRQRTASELRRAGDDDAALSLVLDHLSRWRLVVVSADAAAPAAERRVDLAHDALITGWPSLTGWVAKYREDLRTQRRLEARAAGGGLLADSELPELTRWIAWVATPEGQAIGATEALRTLVRRSVAARRARRITLAVLVAGVIVVLTVAAAISLWQRGIAVEQREVAVVERDKSKQLLVRSAQTYQEIGRQLLVGGEPLKSIPYLVEARRAGAENAPLRMLFAEAVRHLPPVLFEHDGAVKSVAFSRDGTRVVTASADHTARVWDPGTGAPLTAPFEHRETVVGAAFSSEGTRIVTASEDGAVRLWDVTSETLVSTVNIEDAVRLAAFSPDGTRVVTADMSSDGIVHLRDVAATRPAFQLQHPAAVRSVAFSADGARVVTACADGRVRTWEVDTGALRGPALEHEEVGSAAFSPDGTRVVTTGSGKTMLWEATTGKVLRVIDDSAMGSVGFSPDGTRIFAADRAIAWDTATGNAIPVPIVHEGLVNAAAFSPDGTRIVTASDDHTARIWPFATDHALADPLEVAEQVNSAALSPDGTRVVTAQGRTVRVWDAISGKALAPALEHPADVNSVSFSSDGAWIVTACDDAAVRIWSSRSAVLVGPLLPHPGPVKSASLSSDGTRVVTASNDGTARVWDTATGELLAPLDGPAVVNVALFDSGGTRVVTASEDRTARVWEVATRRVLVSFQTFGDLVSASFSPDGTRVVTVSHVLKAQIWDVANGRSLFLPLADVNGAAFSSDGTRVATARYAGKDVQILDALTGKPLAPRFPHHVPVKSVVFSADGTRILAVTQFGTAIVWALSLYQGSLADWESALTHTNYVLRNGLLSQRGIR